MRSLIRPTLFIVARLGLFLAVVAWIVGQRRNVEVAVVEFGYGIFVQVDSAAWFVRRHIQRARSYRIEARPPKRIGEGGFTGTVKISGGVEFETFFQADRSWHCAGVGYAMSPWRDPRISIRHWLVVTVFAAFNGVLMWVYRKRGETPS